MCISVYVSARVSAYVLRQGYHVQTRTIRSASRSFHQSCLERNVAHCVDIKLKRSMSSQSILERPYRIRRTLFSVPGCDERKLAKAPTLNVDSIVLDLEDGVPSNSKTTARELVLNALEKFDFGRSEVCVRINSIGSGFELDDLNVILNSKKLDTIVVPKVQSPSDLQFVDHMINLVASGESSKKIRLLVAIESALALLNLKKIATCLSRLDGLIFAAEDYCADTGIVRTSHRHELQFARSSVVNAAHAYKLHAIDMVCIDYTSAEILEDECREGREMGFTGKQAIHPGQISAIHSHFAPNEKDVSYARRIVEGFSRHAHIGIGAFDIEGKVIDMPVVKWAERIISQDEAVRAAAK